MLSRGKENGVAGFFSGLSGMPGECTSRKFRPYSMKKGWAHFEAVVDEDLTTALGHDLEKAEAICQRVRALNGVDSMASGSLHHIIGLGKSFEEFLGRLYLIDTLREFLGGNVILNSFGGVINRQEDHSYLHAIHRDSRPLPLPFPLLMNMLCY